MSPPPRTSFFVTCAPGVEPVLHAEMRALRLARIERQVGGVYFEGGIQDAWRANLWLRTAVRVLMRVARFPCASESALYAGAQEVDWSRYLAPDGCLVVDAHTSESALDHTRFIEQRVKDAIVDQLRDSAGTRPSVDREQADLGVHAHLFRDRCMLLLDTSGRALHRRGWRVEQGRAPLAETLASAVVQLAEWDARSPLVDPFGGSGTILIEAALAAQGVAPGSFGRSFGFERWPGHDARGWERERARAAQPAARKKGPILRGFDVDPERVREARANAESAGVADVVHFEVADARELELRRGWNAWIVSNLPYGERVGRDADLDALYERFGAVLRRDCVDYHVALLCAAGGPSERLGLAGLGSVRLVNGGIECVLLRGVVLG